MNLATKQTEQTVIGTVMYNPEALHRIGSSVKSSDFYFPEHQELWDVIMFLKVQKLDVNILSVLNVLVKKKPDYNEEYLSDLVNQYHVDVDSALTLSNQIVENAGLRNLKMEIEILTKEINSGEKTFSELISRMSNITSELSAKAFTSSELYGEALSTRFMEMLAAEKSEHKLIGIKSIDDVVVDFSPGEIILVAARPGIGKTAALLQSARTQLEMGRTVGFISLEMPEEKLLQRLVAARSGVAGDKIGKMKPEEFIMNDDLVEALQFYTQNEQLIIDTGAPYDIDTIERVIRKMKYVHNVDVVYVDYIQLIEAPSYEKSANRQQQVSTISRRLKNLFSELKISPVVAAQLSRASVDRPGGPLLSDLRDSGALEQDASIIIFLYAYLPDNLSAEQKELALQAPMLNIKWEIAKQRNGPLQTFGVQFVKNLGVLRPLSASESFFANDSHENL